jgi:sec-independent protein translocase protein TatA
MGSIGPMEVALILVVTLLLFGAGRIAAVGQGFGQAIRQFKEGLREEPGATKGREE